MIKCKIDPSLRGKQDLSKKYESAVDRLWKESELIVLAEFVERLVNNQGDIPPGLNKLIDDHFLELL